MCVLWAVLQLAGWGAELNAEPLTHLLQCGLHDPQLLCGQHGGETEDGTALSPLVAAWISLVAQAGGCVQTLRKQQPGGRSANKAMHSLLLTLKSSQNAIKGSSAGRGYT